MDHNQHVIEWMFWEFKKDKIWYHFPQINHTPKHTDHNGFEEHFLLVGLG